MDGEDVGFCGVVEAEVEGVGWAGEGEAGEGHCLLLGVVAVG